MLLDEAGERLLVSIADRPAYVNAGGRTSCLVD
jgi:hypothetical protein